MNRNRNAHFVQMPEADIKRSVFNIPHNTKTSFNFGEIIPFYWTDVLPGDSVNIRTTKVFRLSTPLTPVFGNMYLDVYYFFVPSRLLWTHFKEFMGENTESAWIPETQFQKPTITSPLGGWNIGTIADYLEVPTGVDNLICDALPFRAYAKICDYWFRDENVSDPLYIDLGDTDVIGSNGSTFVTDVALGGAPYLAAKKHDYFTSALPGPLKHADIQLPLGSFAPVLTSEDSYETSDAVLRFNSTGTEKAINLVGWDNGTYIRGYADNTSSIGGSLPGLIPNNLYTDLSTATAASINQLRMAFAIQHYYEANARMGSRYEEVIHAHFNVSNPDSRVQIPEYLGGNRVPIKIGQVLQNSAQQTAENDNGTPLGTTGAYSLTVDSHSDFVKSFSEFGILMGVCVARYTHNYQNGLARKWTRFDLLDNYVPELANIGETAILNKEIFAQGTDDDDEVFGYQEAWSDYKHYPDTVTGQMRSAANNGFDIWHLADDYASLPTLSDAWIREDKSNVDRVLSVTSAVANQVFGDFFVEARWTRPMPVYSVPGLETM